MSKKVANNFANKITPHYKYFDVKLLDSMDIKTAVSQKSLDSVIEYIKGSRYDKAQMLLLNLADETDKKSFVVFYNLGVIKEIQGEYVEAKKYYELSDSLTKQRVEEIDEALFRIDELIRKKQKVNQQTR